MKRSRELPGAGARTPGVVAAAACLAVLIALLNNWLRFNGYPFLHAEVGIVVLVAAGSALLFGLAYGLAGRLWFWPGFIVRLGLELALVLYAFEWAGASRTLLVVAAVVTIGAAALRRSILAPLGVAAGVMVLTSSLGIGQQTHSAVARSGSPLQTRGSRGPAIVHVILDEHIGVAGLPRDNPGSASLARELRAFYTGHGFRLVGGAYAEQFHTRASIPYILNFGAYRWAEPRSAATSMRDAERWPVPRNAYFDALRERGYPLNVYQSDHIDYCAYRAVRTCLTYASANFPALANSDLSTASKAWLILAQFTPYNELLATVSWASRAMRRRGIMVPELDLAVSGLGSSPAAMHAFDVFIGDLGHAQPGQLYFGHFLLPHYPYMASVDCTLKERRDWVVWRAGMPLRMRQDAYAEQVRCATRKLGEAIAAVRRSPAGDNFVMVVHGDHGSRQTLRDPGVDEGPASDADMIAGYSTLLAVRASGVRPGYDPGHRSVAAALKEWTATGALLRTLGGRRLVYLEDREEMPRRQVSMPLW